MSTGTYRPVPSLLAVRARNAAPFAQHVGLTPRHALAARRQAERQESLGAYEEALRLWQLALLIEPQATRAFTGLVRCLRALDRTDEARRLERNHPIVPAEERLS